MTPQKAKSSWLSSLQDLAMGTVSVLSDTTNTFVANVSVGRQPLAIAYDSSMGEIFVANAGALSQGGNTISVISDATNTVVANVSLGFTPTEITYDPAKDEIFVASEGNRSISVISDATNAVIKTIALTATPIGMVHDPTTHPNGEVFVTTWPPGNGNGVVSVLSDATNTLVANVSVGHDPEGLAYDSNRGDVFVANRNDNTVSVISDATNTVVATVPVGNSPLGVTYDSLKDRIYVANSGDATVSVISPSETPITTTSSTSSSATTSTTSSISSTATSSVSVGVKAGDWLNVSYAITGAPVGSNLPTWIRLDILGVVGTVVTARVTMHMTDGTEQNATVSVDVAGGGGAALPVLAGGIIPANSRVGDILTLTGLGVVTIAGETTKTYAGASRTVVYASLTQSGTQLTYYWDKETGVIVEASVTSGTMSASAAATETNMWAAAAATGLLLGGTFLYLILAVALIVVVAVLALIWRRRSAKVGQGARARWPTLLTGSTRISSLPYPHLKKLGTLRSRGLTSSP